MRTASARHKEYYGTRIRDRKFKPNDKVLILLPTDNNTLTMQWRVAFVVKSKVGENDYRLEVNGEDKTFHANLLKRLVDRLESAGCAEVASAGEILKSTGAHCLMVEENGVAVMWS